MLRVLGLGELEERAYRALVASPSAEPPELAAQLAIRTSEAAVALDSLERLGLAARSSTSVERYVASPPAVALAALLIRRQEELRRAELDIATLAETYRRTDSDRRVGDVVDVVYGASAVRQRLFQLNSAATTEVIGFTKAEVAVLPGEENTAETAAAERGVQYRVVVERESLNRPKFVEGARAAVESGEEVRVADRLPIRLLVIDRQIALVSLDSDGTPSVGALMIHQSGLLDALIALFERVWRESTPLLLSPRSVVETTAEGMAAVDSDIFALLLAGLTDQATANQLGLSLRTVQRRVRLLMDAVGAQTRLQLGFHAAKRGWDQPVTSRGVHQ